MNPQKALASVSAFFNEAHLQCMKRVAKQTHDTSAANASYRTAMLHFLTILLPGQDFVGKILSKYVS